jgi:hypothetical protein
MASFGVVPGEYELRVPPPVTHSSAAGGASTAAVPPTAFDQHL